MANSSITLEGVDQTIADLNYRPGTVKHKAIMAIRNFYSSDASIKELDSINTDTLIKSIWDVGDNFTRLKSKRRNFSSLRSSINTDLKKLLKKNQNSENIIIADSNIFDLTQEAKENLLGSFSDAFKKGDVDLEQAANILETIAESLDKLKQKERGKDYQNIEDKIKSALDKITNNVLSGTGDGSAGSSPGNSGLETDDKQPEGELGNHQELKEAYGEPDEEAELEDDEELEEVEIDDEQLEDEIEEVDLEEDEQLEEIEEPDDEPDEIEIDEDEQLEEVDEPDDDLEEIEVDDDEELEEVEDIDDIEEAEVEDDEELEEIEIDDEQLEEVDEPDDDLEEIEVDDDEELEEVDELDDEELKALEEFREKKELAEQFDQTLGQREKKYNKYTIIPHGLYTVGTKKGIKAALELQQFEMPEVYIGIYPVINSLFEIFIEETGYVTTAEKAGFGRVYYSRFKKSSKGLILNKNAGSEDVKGACWYQPSGPDSSLHHKRNHPVVQVSVDDALSFASWIGRRIPTQAEWESAARTDSGYKYPWGNEFDKKALNTEQSGFSDTSSVDEYENFANQFKVIDMLGNVMEWTSDMELPPLKSKQNRKYCIAKGGAWNTKDDLTISSRVLLKPGFTSNTIGFRCISEILL